MKDAAHSAMICYPGGSNSYILFNYKATKILLTEKRESANIAKPQVL